MPEFIDLTKTVAAVQTASALTEKTFLRIGQALEASIGILSNLASSFEKALTELKNEKLGHALKSLGTAAARVGELGRDQSAASVKFGEMQRVAEAIGERVSKMNRSIRGVDALAINSKIAAANIRGSKIDFTTFASEIARTLAITQSSLDSFGSELQAVRSHVGRAFAGQIAFEKSQSEAIRSIPERLNATVSSMPSQQKRNAQAISAVGQRSQRIGQQVRSAITALQAGDITRQRLEHAEYALNLLTEPQETGDHPALTREEQQVFTTTTCRLQSAQLAATAEEFERNVRQIATSLNSMAGEARVSRTLASSTYGSADRDHGTFIGDLEAQVGAALALFEDYGTARIEATRIMISVSDAAEGLCEHLRTVQSLEDDIRIMGLNTTLNCARIGPEGRALGLIAQELRAYGNEFAREASALIGEVGSLTQLSGSIVSKEPDAAALVGTVTLTMRDSLATLRQIGHTIDDTLSTLERDSDRVVLLLEETAANLVGNDGIGEALRQAVGYLEALAPSNAAPGPDLAPRAQQMLDMIARVYTMANERVVHDRILGRSGSATFPAVAAAAAKPDLEDMLF
jgi:hypothetical protein